MRARIVWALLTIILAAAWSLPKADVLERQLQPRLETALQTYADQDAATPLKHRPIVFTGSSTIALWRTLVEDMAPLTVLNRGIAGSTMQDSLTLLHDLVLKYRPSAVVLYQGDNDISDHKRSAEEVLKDFQMFVSRTHEGAPDTLIYFLSIKPSRARWSVWPEMERANYLIRDFCNDQKGVYFIDVVNSTLRDNGMPNEDMFESDKLHLNRDGYKRWASVVRPVLLKDRRSLGAMDGGSHEVVEQQK